jgi:hypothetical protein
VIPVALIGLLAVSARAASPDAAGMLADYAAAIESRVELDAEIERRLELFARQSAGVLEELNSLSETSKSLCGAAVTAAGWTEVARDRVAAVRAKTEVRLEETRAAAKGSCDAYAAKTAVRLRDLALAYSIEAVKHLKDARDQSARYRRRLREIESLRGPWLGDSEKTAYVRDQAEAIATLFSEAANRQEAARVSLAEIGRLADPEIAAAAPPARERDYAAWKRDALDKPLAHLDGLIARSRCDSPKTDALDEALAEGAAFDRAADEIVETAEACRERAGEALARELAEAPAIAEAARIEELAYERDRKRHLSRDLEEWRRRRARERRRLVQQRRFAKTMRPPRPGKTSPGSGRKGPWLAWGSQSVDDAPIRLRVSDADAFDADPSPYKRLLRARAFRSAKSAVDWVCGRIAGVRERAVLGRSAEFGDEIVSVGSEIRCD